jgi:cell surface protein SprA
VVNAFAITDQNSYRYQDVGMDGLGSTDANAFQAGLNEQQFFQSYLDSLLPGAKYRWQNDPSADDYHFFRGSDYDSPPRSILDRYKRFNGLEGNSITDEDSPEDYPTQATTLPTTEDINQDQNLSESESYFQYRIRLRPSEMVVGQNFIADRILGTTPRGPKQVYWYQFKVPVRQPEKAGERHPGLPLHPVHAALREGLVTAHGAALCSAWSSCVGNGANTPRAWRPRAK